MAVQMSIPISEPKMGGMNDYFEALEANASLIHDHETREKIRTESETAETDREEIIKEAVKRKMDTVIEIPEKENVLIYRQQVIREDRERSLESALDFMVNMASRSRRTVLSHSVAFEPKIANPLSRWDSPPKYFYCITMILAPA